MTHSLPSSSPAGFWSKAYIITFEEADRLFRVGTPVNRSTKAIPVNIASFLFMLSLFIRYACNFMDESEG